MCTLAPDSANTASGLPAAALKPARVLGHWGLGLDAEAWEMDPVPLMVVPMEGAGLGGCQDIWTDTAPSVSPLPFCNRPGGTIFDPRSPCKLPGQVCGRLGPGKNS